MEKLSDQIREVVRRSGVSCYAIAKRIGVSETLLCRFLSGERGLSLESLDKLAEMFGIMVLIGSQTLPRPVKRGRKSQKEDPMIAAMSKKQLKEHWKKLAAKAAEEACKENFESRRGLYEVVKTPNARGSVICVYNNNPWDDFKDGKSARRDAETEEFRAALAKEGIEELAYETYPKSGEDAGYTFAMIVDAGIDKLDWMADTLTDIVTKSMDRMER